MITRSVILLVAIFALALFFIYHLFLTSVFNGNEQNVNEERGIHLVDAYVDGEPLRLEVARTRDSVIKGLSGREGLGDIDGLLMVFPVSGKHGIWMKDMNFAIDIIWIGPSGEIVFIKEDVSPDTYPEVFKNDEPSSMVLEVESGTVEERGWSVGSSFEISADIEFEG